MIDRDPYAESGSGDVLSLVRVFASLVLLMFGICTAIWLLVSLAGALSGEQPPGIVTAVAPAVGEPIEVKAGPTAWELPRQLFVAAAYFVLCLLYLIAASITKAILASGVALLQPDFKQSLARLERIQSKHVGRPSQQGR